MQCQTTQELNDVVSVTLEEELPFARQNLPTLTLVRTDLGDLWELAKRYHSSVEAIQAINETLAAGNSALLLIPREV